ncbi:MAG: MBL fold metallo-hydrolase [Candidatus Kryptoniota bacterium]
MVEIYPFVLGMVQTNTYLIGDNESKEAVVIDPADDGREIVDEARQRQWTIKSIWITHAHFDHIGGVQEIRQLTESSVTVGLHSADLPLWRNQGGAALFGIQFDVGAEPDFYFYDRQILNLGNYQFEVRHTPGHTAGHVVFYCSRLAVCFCGDLIFQGSVGRTDLPGGNFDQLINSIQLNILTLPDKTRLFAGHGPETTVFIERMENPFL